MIPRIVVTAVLLASAATLEGCILAAGAAGASGGYELSAERPFTTSIRDAGIAAAVSQSWKTFNPRLAEDLDATVYEGRVLATGTVPSEDWRGEAIKRAWQQSGVKEVYDEIEVGPDEGFMQDLGDDAISDKLRAQLIGDGDVKSINYTLTTVKGVVYIIGTARSQEELNRVVDHARNISGVRRVVSYIRIRSGEPQRPETASAPPSGPPASSASAAPYAGPGDQISPPTPRQEIDVTPLK